MSTSSTVLRVLVVDDSATVRAMVADVLRAGVTGFDAVELHEAENGEEAMLLAHLASPHVILMDDVQMPRMDGLQALRAMQDTALQEVPIVMLTRMETPSDLLPGAHDHGAVRGCQRVLAAVTQPLDLADGPPSVTISIGLADVSA